MALLLSHHHLFGQIPRNQLRKHNGQLIQIRNIQIPIPIDALDPIPVCPDCCSKNLHAASAVLQLDAAKVGLRSTAAVVVIVRLAI